MAKRTSLAELMQQTNPKAVQRATDRTAKKTEKFAVKTSRGENKAEEVVQPNAESEAVEEAAAEKNEIIKATIYLPLAVYDQLRSLHFEEQRGRAKRIKMHDYFLESLDLLFKQRGLKSIADLTKND